MHSMVCEDCLNKDFCKLYEKTRSTGVFRYTFGSNLLRILQEDKIQDSFLPEHITVAINCKYKRVRREEKVMWLDCDTGGTDTPLTEGITVHG